MPDNDVQLPSPSPLRSKVTLFNRYLPSRLRSPRLLLPRLGKRLCLEVRRRQPVPGFPQAGVLEAVLPPPHHRRGHLHSPPARPLPWKGLGIGAGLLAGLALLVGLGTIAIRNYLLAEQSVLWHATFTAMASVAELTPTPSPLSPSHTPSPQPLTLTPSPVPAMPSDTPSGPFEYTVQAGDTLAAIATRFDSDIMTLLAMNPAIDPVAQILNVGQKILIPAPGATIDTQISPVDGMVLRHIPAGTFQMGEDADRSLAECQLLYEPFTSDTCSRDWFTDEEPVHTVTLDAFWMDQTEVTNGMYAQCVAAGACSPPD